MTTMFTPATVTETVTQLLDINTKRLVPMCFASERVDRGLSSGVPKGAQDAGPTASSTTSASTTCQHWLVSTGPMATATASRPTPTTSTSSGGSASSPIPVRTDFLYAGEACTDWQLSEYHLSYHRSESPTHVPLMRFLRPDALLMTAVTGFNDRNMINQCLLYRYVVSYEPYNFKGRITDMPLTVSYGQEMDELRTELREWLWDGEFQDTLGASVTLQHSGADHLPYAVFRSQKDGSNAVVVANYSSSDVTLNVVLEGKEGGTYRLVDDPQWRDADGGVVVPARSTAVVLEHHC